MHTALSRPVSLLSRTPACPRRVARHDRPDPRKGIGVKNLLGFTTQPISRESDEAGVKRDRRGSEELREREHVRNRPTRLLRPIRLRRIADGNEECRDLIIAETKLT